MDVIKKVKNVEQEVEPAIVAVDASTSPEPAKANPISDTLTLLTRKEAEEILKRKVTDEDWAKIVGVITSDKDFTKYTKLRMEGFCFNY